MRLLSESGQEAIVERDQSRVQSHATSALRRAALRNQAARLGEHRLAAVSQIATKRIYERNRRDEVSKSSEILSDEREGLLHRFPHRFRWHLRLVPHSSRQKSVLVDPADSPEHGTVRTMGEQKLHFLISQILFIFQIDHHL